ncbi:MAG: hypothetical protein F9K23_09570 [Bacteroidetes bacterium]|nr:MAG: hypothetical protein F9K23_09570 [Bacteroidota bacterium]
MKKILALVTLLTIVASLKANNVKVENVTYDKNTKKITFDLSWENAWRQTIDYHDAVWVFAKYRTVNQPRWQHANIVFNSTNVAGGALETIETNDKYGFFVRLKTDSVGNIQPTQVSFEATDGLTGLIGLYPDFQVYAIEMVYVPQGSFYVGAPPTKYDANLFEDMVIYRYNPTHTNPTFSPLYISSEDKISTGNTFASPYISSKGISASFPKGYNAFYCMKHEVSNEQLVAFFNAIGTDFIRFYGLGMSGSSSGFKYKNITRNQDTVDIVGTKTTNGWEFTCEAGYENHPAVMTPYTLISYLAWAGLVPMTELQYVKACRGPLQPVRNEAACGVSVTTALGGNTIGSEDTFFVDLKTPAERLKRHYSGPTTRRLRRCGYAADSTTNRITANATFYGILNMTDNVAEITISINDTNEFYTGILDHPNNAVEPDDYGMKSYIVPAYFSESGYGSNVLYYRGSENGEKEYYDPYNFFEPTDEDGTTRTYFPYPIGGRGVRKPN